MKAVLAGLFSGVVISSVASSIALAADFPTGKFTCPDTVLTVAEAKVGNESLPVMDLKFKDVHIKGLGEIVTYAGDTNTRLVVRGKIFDFDKNGAIICY